MFDNNGSFLLAMLEFIVFFAYLMCLFWIFSDLFRSHDLSGWAKTLWVLFIIVVPLFGMLVYLIARGGGMQQRAMDQAEAIQQQQNAYIRSVAGNGSNTAEQIATAKKLLDQGVITQGDFDKLKAKALA